MAKGTRKPAAWEITIDVLREKLARAEVDRNGNFNAFEEAAGQRNAARAELSALILENMRLLAERDALKAEIAAMTDAIIYREAEQTLRAEAEACEIHEAISAAIDESVDEP